MSEPTLDNVRHYTIDAGRSAVCGADGSPLLTSFQESVTCADCASGTPEQGLIARYQRCALRIWKLFGVDPLPIDDPAHFWIERLESILDRNLITPTLGTPEIERAVVREALRQWARDRRTLDAPLLQACNDLQVHVKDATRYAK